MLIDVAKAQELVLELTRAPRAITLPLGDCLGLILAEDVASDIDMPPYDKSLMDGFAVRTRDLADGHGELELVGEIFAGQPPWQSDQALTAGQAARIMTGAPIPPGADAIVMMERTTHSGHVKIDDPRMKPGQNIMRRGAEMTRGQVVLHAGTRLRPPEIGVLAAVGRARVSVYPQPKVAIISTGNEIVEAGERLGPGQIRNSNGPTLAALVVRAGGTPEYLGIARDTTDDLRRLVARGLQSEFLLLSGGVSAGDLDLVPGVLRELGAREVFHKVNLKPGKPLWFGVADDQRSQISNLKSQIQSSSLVFGLPGNPVSVMVCFELFVRPAIRRMMGFGETIPSLLTAALDSEKSVRGDRPTYWPAWVEQGDGGLRVRLVAWQGSPDLRATTEANAFAVFPPGDRDYRAGDRVQVMCTEY